MISIIESLRTILEQPEIRKRLIVVISIDNLFLWNALERKYNESSDKVNYIIKNAFDKLFISSITLPEIDYDGEVEFLAKIEHGNMSIASNSSIAIESTDANNNQLKKSANIDRDNKRSKERMTEDNNAVVRNILSLIKAFLDKNRHIHLTPRQINCVFYRTLLANNLLVSLKGGDSIDTSLVEHIILLTCKDKHYISGTIDDILKMVIPYPASYIISQSRPMGF